MAIDTAQEKLEITENALRVARAELEIYQDFHRDVSAAGHKEHLIEDALERCQKRCAAFVFAIKTGHFNRR